MSLSACKGEGWGDKFKTFVENDMAGLSVAFARSQFAKKWANAYRDRLAFSNEQLRQTTRLAIAFTFKGPPDDIQTLPEPEVLSLYLSQLNAGAVLNDIDSLAFGAQSGLKRAAEICEDREAFYLMDLNNEVLRGMFAMTKPEENETYYLGNDAGQMIAFWVTELFGRSEYRKQSEAFHQGMDLLPSKIMRDDVLFALSSGICAARRDRAKVPMDAMIQSYDRLRTYISKRRRELATALAISEHLVLKIGRTRLRDTYGISEDILGHLAFAETEKIERGITKAYFEWLSSKSAAETEQDPLRRLLLQEAHDDLSLAMQQDLAWLQTQDLAPTSTDLIQLLQAQLAEGGQ
ncbi:hypothetical protein [Pseudophaeobacter sp.]|uniref:hypothetical protein n=1 Tax=Pseudophaeobacter sp. TaxID=1971739 RepID=UPI0032998AF0